MSRKPNKEYMPATHDPILTRLWAIPLSVEHIAENMGFSVVTIGRRASDLNLPTQSKRYDKQPPPPKERLNPVQEAKERLKERLVEKSGAYWLDGRPVRLPQMMKEANRARVAEGLPQIDTNPEWLA